MYNISNMKKKSDNELILDPPTNPLPVPLPTTIKSYSLYQKKFGIVFTLCGYNDI